MKYQDHRIFPGKLRTSNVRRDKPISVSIVKRKLFGAGLKECIAVLKLLLKHINKKRDLIGSQKEREITKIGQQSIEKRSSLGMNQNLTS